MNPPLMPSHQPGDRVSRRRLPVVLPIVSLLAAGSVVLAACSGSGPTPGVGGSSAAAACSGSDGEEFSPYAFTRDMGAALGSFQEGVWKPHEADELNPSERSSRSVLSGAGLAAAGARWDVEDALENVSRDPVLCEALAAPLTELNTVLIRFLETTHVEKVFADAVDPEALLTDVTRAEALFAQVVEVSGEHGLTIRASDSTLFP